MTNTTCKAADEVISKVREIETTISSLLARLDRYRDEAGRGAVDYGHLGDLGYVDRLVTEANNFLNPVSRSR